MTDSTQPSMVYGSKVEVDEEAGSSSSSCACCGSCCTCTRRRLIVTLCCLALLAVIIGVSVHLSVKHWDGENEWDVKGAVLIGCAGFSQPVIEVHLDMPLRRAFDRDEKLVECANHTLVLNGTGFTPDISDCRLDLANRVYARFEVPTALLPAHLNPEDCTPGFRPLHDLMRTDAMEYSETAVGMQFASLVYKIDKDEQVASRAEIGETVADMFQSTPDCDIVKNYYAFNAEHRGEQAFRAASGLFFDMEKTDDSAIICRGKLKFGLAEGKTVCYIGFTGSNDKEDFVNDAIGFKSELLTFIKNGRMDEVYERICSVPEDPINEVFISGHSLGGALSILYAQHLDDAALWEYNRTHVFAVGSPRPYDKDDDEFRGHLASFTTIRAVNTDSSAGCIFDTIAGQPLYEHFLPGYRREDCFDGSCVFNYMDLVQTPEGVQTAFTPAGSGTWVLGSRCGPSPFAHPIAGNYLSVYQDLVAQFNWTDTSLASVETTHCDGKHVFERFENDPFIPTPVFRRQSTCEEGVDCSCGEGRLCNLDSFLCEDAA